MALITLDNSNSSIPEVCGYDLDQALLAEIAWLSCAILTQDWMAMTNKGTMGLIRPFNCRKAPGPP